jgi:hypothetical protein
MVGEDVRFHCGTGQLLAAAWSDLA